MNPPENRLTQKLTDMEARCARLENANAELESLNDKLAGELQRITAGWERDLSQKADDQHAKHAPIAALFTEGGSEDVA